jgi:hypothetical protein
VLQSSSDEIFTLPGTSRTQLSSPHGIFYEQSTNSLLIVNSGGNNIVRWVIGDTEWSIVAGNANGSIDATAQGLNSVTDVMFSSFWSVNQMLRRLLG